MQRDMLTVAEAARELGMSVRGVHDRMARGLILGERVTTRLWLVPRAEVERWKGVGRLKPGPRPRAKLQQAPAPVTDWTALDDLDALRERLAAAGWAAEDPATAMDAIRAERAAELGRVEV